MKTQGRPEKNSKEGKVCNTAPTVNYKYMPQPARVSYKTHTEEAHTHIKTGGWGAIIEERRKGGEGGFVGTDDDNVP